MSNQASESQDSIRTPGANATQGGMIGQMTDPYGKDFGLDSEAAESAPPRFEYRVTSSPSPATTEEIVELLNRFGYDGWELVEMNYGSFVLKRQVRDA